MKFRWSFMLKTRTSQHKWSEQGHVHGHWEQRSLHFNSDCTETRRAFWACPTEANRQARDYCPAWFYLLIFHPAPRVWVTEQCTSHTQHHLLDWSPAPHSRCQPLWGQKAVLEVVAGALWALFQPCCNVCSESSSSPAASPCPCWAEVSLRGAADPPALPGAAGWCWRRSCPSVWAATPCFTSPKGKEF